MNRNRSLALGFAATLAATWLWHGPGGAGDRLTGMIAREVRDMLDHYEMQQVTAVAGSAPLSRQILLGGPADDFQRAEIVRMSEDLPGVAAAVWTSPHRQGRSLPLLAEAMIMALVAFTTGVVLAYVAALRRRARAALLA